MYFPSLTTAFAVASALGCCAAQASTFSSVDVVFIVDESGSMAGEHAFLQSFIGDLDSGLASAGVTSRNYAVIGFGSASDYGNPVDHSGGLTDLGTAGAALSTLEISGATEDGYEAIQYALDELKFSATATNFILVTDEDRDVTSADTYASVLAALQAQDVLLNAVLNQYIYDTSGDRVIGVDDELTSYTADGSGGFSESVYDHFGYGAGSTTADYADLALATGGAVWDLNILRSGGDDAASFASAFLDIKVQEVTDQIDDSPSPVPLPAGLWLGITGAAALGLLRRRRA